MIAIFAAWLYFIEAPKQDRLAIKNRDRSGRWTAACHRQIIDNAGHRLAGEPWKLRGE